MHVSDAAKEVDELGERQLQHPVFVAHRVDYSHERLCKNDTKHGLRYVELTLCGQGLDFFEIDSLLSSVGEVLEGGIEDVIVAIEKLTDAGILNEHLSELIAVDSLRIRVNDVIQQDLKRLTDRDVFSLASLCPGFGNECCDSDNDLNEFIPEEACLTALFQVVSAQNGLSP